MSKFQNNPTISKPPADVAPTKERAQHNGGVKEEVVAWDADGNPVATRFRAVWECPLDAYRDHGVINKAEHKTGIEFRRVYYGVVFSRQPETRPTTEAQAVRKPTTSETKLKEAYDTLPFDELDVIVTVCGNNHHIWNARAYEKLRRGLGHLAVAWHSAAIEVCDP